jgi:hypothetical protein
MLALKCRASFLNLKTTEMFYVLNRQRLSTGILFPVVVTFPVIIPHYNIPVTFFIDMRLRILNKRLNNLYIHYLPIVNRE